MWSDLPIQVSLFHAFCFPIRGTHNQPAASCHKLLCRQNVNIFHRTVAEHRCTATGVYSAEHGRHDPQQNAWSSPLFSLSATFILLFFVPFFGGGWSQCRDHWTCVQPNSVVFAFSADRWRILITGNAAIPLCLVQRRASSHRDRRGITERYDSGVWMSFFLFDFSHILTVELLLNCDMAVMSILHLKCKIRCGLVLFDTEEEFWVAFAEDVECSLERLCVKTWLIFFIPVLLCWLLTRASGNLLAAWKNLQNVKIDAKTWQTSCENGLLQTMI